MKQKLEYKRKTNETERWFLKINEMYKHPDQIQTDQEKGKENINYQYQEWEREHQCRSGRH